MQSQAGACPERTQSGVAHGRRLGQSVIHSLPVQGLITQAAVELGIAGRFQSTGQY